MSNLLNAAILLAILSLLANSSFATQKTDFCGEISEIIKNENGLAHASPARQPTQTEKAIIANANIELLENEYEGNGTVIVDADNDGKDDLFVWSIQGSGRFVYAALFDLQTSKNGNVFKLVPKGSLELGNLFEPTFIRHKGFNYMVYYESGEHNKPTVSRIARLSDGTYNNYKNCITQIAVKTATKCGHPACKKLKEMIANGAFESIVRPYANMAPAGLEVYFSQNNEAWDFDNTKDPINIWKFGITGHLYQNIFWKLLGLGTELPEISSTERAEFEKLKGRHVLSGLQHNRLRRTLEEQGDVLSRELGRSIIFPRDGDFFLFKAHEDRTYWAWDFGGPPLGEEIHITYTNSKKSDYIGLVTMKEIYQLVTCEKSCVNSFNF